MLTAAEGGRSRPFFHGYRPQFHFRATDMVGGIDLGGDGGMPMPGNTVEMAGPSR